MLRTLMREGERSGRSLEKQLGWSSGYLSQVLRSGPPALKVSHVHDLLTALKVEPADFFARLYGSQEAVQRDQPGSLSGSPATAPGTVKAGTAAPSANEAESGAALGLEQIERLVDRRIAEERDLRRQELARVRALVNQALARPDDREPVDLDRIELLVGEALTTELRRLEAERQRPRQSEGRGDL